MRPVALRK